MKPRKTVFLILVLLAGAPLCARAGFVTLAAQVVVIDAGHGGEDTGAIGPGGTREKDVALAVALALARELARYPEMEVHLTRDRDVLIPLWERGRRATDLKGGRPGIFISLHANALPLPSSVRGFETYFLSEARTEDERRVAAVENAPMALGREEATDAPDAGLDFILMELRNLGHQPWSALLAQLVQERLKPVHPGADRGVKQGPFAVITNAMMPAVLVELGFLSHAQEEQLLTRADFHQATASALADAILAFFRRYPIADLGRDATPAADRSARLRAPRAGAGCMSSRTDGEVGVRAVQVPSADARREIPCPR